jgi:hypothetical protein
VPVRSPEPRRDEVQALRLGYWPRLALTGTHRCAARDEDSGTRKASKNARAALQEAFSLFRGAGLPRGRPHGRQQTLATRPSPSPNGRPLLGPPAYFAPVAKIAPAETGAIAETRG